MKLTALDAVAIIAAIALAYRLYNNAKLRAKNAAPSNAVAPGASLPGEYGSYPYQPGSAIQDQTGMVERLFNDPYWNR